MRSPSIFAALAVLAWAAPAAADVTVFEAPKVADFRLDLYGWMQPRLAVQEHDDRPGVSFDPNPAFNVQRDTPNIENNPAVSNGSIVPP